MTDQIRDAAQALADISALEHALERLVNRCNADAFLATDEAVIHAEATLERLYIARRLASSVPQPAADERVAEHIRTVAKACAASRSVGIAAAMNRDQLGAAYVEESAALAAVESSARALLAAERDEAQQEQSK